jgi:hypothetical protein
MASSSRWPLAGLVAFASDSFFWQIFARLTYNAGSEIGLLSPME